MLTLLQSTSSSPGIPLAPVITVVAMVTLVVVMVLVSLKAGRARRRALSDQFARLNMVGSIDPDDSQKAGVYHRFPTLQKIMRHGHGGVVWYADLAMASPPVFVMEHSYRVSTGKSSHNVYHTAAVVRVPDAWGEVSVTRETMFTRFGKLFGLKDIDLEDPAFNKTWRVRAQDENFALALLSPELQQFLASPQGALRNETWVCGGGGLAVIVDGYIKPEQLSAIIGRVHAAVAVLAPELREQISALAAR